MPDYVRLGKDEWDLAFMNHFSRGRCLLRINTRDVGGMELDTIPPGRSGLHPAMALWKKGWHNIYFVIEREGWTEDDYFTYAEKRQKEFDLDQP